MLTVYETPTFVAEAAKVWSTDERLEFFAWIANEPDAGAVIKDSGGCRKVRWSRPGTGKQGGVRVVYFTRLAAGELCMLLVYPKAARDTIPGHILRMIRKEIEDGID
ncbi:MAG: transcriptional regulator [Proteobacteria bacterium]|nr:transcriptional regulator [Pseudomonadota bacterium]